MVSLTGIHSDIAGIALQHLPVRDESFDAVDFYCGLYSYRSEEELWCTLIEMNTVMPVGLTCKVVQVLGLVILSDPPRLSTEMTTPRQDPPPNEPACAANVGRWLTVFPEPLAKKAL